MYTSCNLYVSPTEIVFEPNNQTQKTQNLVYSRDQRTISLQWPSALRSEPSGAPTICLGLLGWITLHSGDYLMYVSERKKVGQLNGKDVFRVVKSTLLPTAVSFHHMTPAQIRDEERYRMMLESVLEKGSFYYAVDFDLTTNLQHQYKQQQQPHLPFWQRADRRFLWNRYLSKKLSEAADAEPGIGEYIVPLMHGFVGIQSLRIRNHSFTYALLSRQGALRAGTRFNSRGVDEEGNVSNFAETEQLLIFPDGSMQSHLQIRGSIPLFWKQVANVKYKPGVEIDLRRQDAAQAFKKHFQTLTEMYGDIIVLNLIDKKGHELLVGESFTKGIADLADPRIQYTHFDFHQECRKMQWQNIAKLIAQYEKALVAQGYFAMDAKQKVTREQTSVVRTNCIDCLDRTNVVQSMVARHIVQLQLRESGVLQPNELLQDHAAAEHAFKNIWADNADAISMQYSGTGALKTDFTRTGKRSHHGTVQDGINSAIRYIKNNFMDGMRQDSIDLFLGLYDVALDGTTSPFEDKRTLKMRLFPMILAFSLMMLFLTLFLHFDAWSNRMTVTLFWSGIAYVCFKAIVTNGIDFVDKPRLRTPAYLARRTQIPPFASEARVIAGDNATPSIGIAQVKQSDIPKENTTFAYSDGKKVHF